MGRPKKYHSNEDRLEAIRVYQKAYHRNYIRKPRNEYIPDDNEEKILIKNYKRLAKELNLC